MVWRTALSHIDIRVVGRSRGHHRAPQAPCMFESFPALQGTQNHGRALQNLGKIADGRRAALPHFRAGRGSRSHRRAPQGRKSRNCVDLSAFGLISACSGAPKPWESTPKPWENLGRGPPCPILGPAGVARPPPSTPGSEIAKIPPFCHISGIQRRFRPFGALQTRESSRKPWENLGRWSGGPTCAISGREGVPRPPHGLQGPGITKFRPFLPAPGAFPAPWGPCRTPQARQKPWETLVDRPEGT